MQWADQGIVLGVRRQGETSVILEALTRGHGRHLGLVHGGRSRRQQPVLQPGNAVQLTWRARLDEQLGAFAVEADTLHAARILGSGTALRAVGHVTALLRLLPERDPHPLLFDRVAALMAGLQHAETVGALVARFELALLAELGFGLDLGSCVATGVDDDLVYVSPKSGRAVSRQAGEPWHERLLPLPAFLLDDRAEPDAAAVEQAFRLTGYFIERDLLEPRGLVMPDGRAALIQGVRR